MIALMPALFSTPCAATVTSEALRPALIDAVPCWTMRLPLPRLTLPLKARVPPPSVRVLPRPSSDPLKVAVPPPIADNVVGAKRATGRLVAKPLGTLTVLCNASRGMICASVVRPKSDRA